MNTERRKPRWWELSLLLVLLGVAAAWFSWHNAFPYTLHADEGKKGHFILGGTPDFHHPLLLIQTGRVIRSLTGWDGLQGAVLAGRWASVLAGVALLAGFVRWARPRIGVGGALGGAVLVAVTPLVAVHTHYAKEDLLLTAAVMGVALALRRWRFGPGRWADVALGVALGGAAATHYKSVLVLILVAWTARARGEPAAWWRILSMAGVVFVALNLNGLVHPGTLAEGAGMMFSDAVGGQQVDVYPVPYLYTYHLGHSLGPGLGWGLLGWSLLGAVMVGRAGRTACFEDRLALGAVVVFYLAVELLPKKPPPDFGRYVLPCVPFLVWLALRAMQSLWTVWRGPWARGALAGLMILALVEPLHHSWRVLSGLESDTRITVESWLSVRQAAAVSRGENMIVLKEKYATAEPEGVNSVAEVDLAARRAEGLTHVLVSSFRYERFFAPEVQVQQRKAVHRYAAFYRALFDQPYEELQPDGVSYAFSNPVLRLVDIRGMDLDGLTPIGP